MFKIRPTDTRATVAYVDNWRGALSLVQVGGNPHVPAVARRKVHAMHADGHTRATIYYNILPLEACYLTHKGQLACAPYKWEPSPHGVHACDHTVTNDRVRGWIAVESYDVDDDDADGEVTWFVSKFNDDGEHVCDHDTWYDNPRDAQREAVRLNLADLGFEGDPALAEVSA